MKRTSKQQIIEFSDLALPDPKKDNISVVEYLKLNQNRHITSEVLETIFEISGSEIRAIIHDARMDGVPIASNVLGYCYTLNKTVLEDSLRHLQTRARAISEVARAMEYTLSKI